jgi:SPP1 gp7 family putative phage head morphogenesis protein
MGSLVSTTYNSRDWALNEQLTHNAGVFAAFKNHQEQKELVSLLVDENGEVRSFSKFKQAAGPIAEKYNKNWLTTEHNQALSSAEMAKKWNGFKADQDLYPNLEYVAVMDSQTRSSHAKLNGTIRPIDDPFWDGHYPPLDWGCRCDVVQTDKPAKGTTDVEPGSGFDHNPGKTGKLFSDSAGYYDVPVTEANQVKGMADELIKDVMIRQAHTELRNRFVRSGKLKVSFEKSGIERTAKINAAEKGTKALALLHNSENVQQLIKAGVHSVSGNIHTWTGTDAGINFVIKAFESVQGTLVFDSIKLI